MRACSAASLTRTSISASACSATTFERDPPATTPVLIVVPRSGACERMHGQDLAGEFGDRRRAGLRRDARVRRDAMHVEPERPDALPGGLQHAAGQRRLEDEHGGARARLRLDQRARRRAADLLVGREQEAQAQIAQVRARDGRGEDRDRQAGLHVEGAGTVQSAVADLDRHLRERADRPHGVEVPEQQHLSRAIADRGAQVRAGPGRAGARPPRPRPQAARRLRRHSGRGPRRRRSATRCARASADGVHEPVTPARARLPQAAARRSSRGALDSRCERSHVGHAEPLSSRHEPAPICGPAGPAPASSVARGSSSPRGSGECGRRPTGPRAAGRPWSASHPTGR